MSRWILTKNPAGIIIEQPPRSRRASFRFLKQRHCRHSRRQQEPNEFADLGPARSVDWRPKVRFLGKMPENAESSPLSHHRCPPLRSHFLLVYFKRITNSSAQSGCTVLFIDIPYVMDGNLDATAKCQRVGSMLILSSGAALTSHS